MLSFIPAAIWRPKELPEITPVLSSGIRGVDLNPRALESYLRLLWVPEPLTLFDGILKVEPGTLLSWDGQRIVTASRDGTATIYACELCVPLPDLMTLADARVSLALTGGNRGGPPAQQSAANESQR